MESETPMFANCHINTHRSVLNLDWISYRHDFLTPDRNADCWITDVWHTQLTGLGEKDADLSTSGNEQSLLLKAKGAKKRRFTLKLFPRGVWAVISENMTHVQQRWTMKQIVRVVNWGVSLLAWELTEKPGRSLEWFVWRRIRAGGVSMNWV